MVQTAGHIFLGHYTPDASLVHGRSLKSQPFNGGSYRTNEAIPRQQVQQQIINSRDRNPQA